MAMTTEEVRAKQAMDAATKVVGGSAKSAMATDQEKLTKGLAVAVPAAAGIGALSAAPAITTPLASTTAMAPYVPPVAGLSALGTAGALAAPAALAAGTGLAAKGYAEEVGKPMLASDLGARAAFKQNAVEEVAPIQGKRILPDGRVVRSMPGIAPTPTLGIDPMSPEGQRAGADAVLGQNFRSGSYVDPTGMNFTASHAFGTAPADIRQAPDLLPSHGPETEAPLIIPTRPEGPLDVGTPVMTEKTPEYKVPIGRNIAGALVGLGGESAIARDKKLQAQEQISARKAFADELSARSSAAKTAKELRGEDSKFSLTAADPSGMNPAAPFKLTIGKDDFNLTKEQAGALDSRMQMIYATALEEGATPAEAEALSKSMSENDVRRGLYGVPLPTAKKGK